MATPSAHSAELALGTVALFADSSAPVAFFLRGFHFFTLACALQGTVLAAVLERPFVSKAGITEHAIWYSLQANLVSGLIGLVCAPVAITAVLEVPLLWPFTAIVAVIISTYSEGTYYRWFALEQGQSLQWGWIAFANFFSSFVLFMFAPLLADFVYFHPNRYNRWVSTVEPFQAQILWSSLTACVAALVWSFVVTTRAQRQRRLRRLVLAAEVLPPAANGQPASS